MASLQIARWEGDVSAFTQVSSSQTPWSDPGCHSTQQIAATHPTAVTTAIGTQARKRVFVVEPLGIWVKRGRLSGPGDNDAILPTATITATSTPTFASDPTCHPSCSQSTNTTAAWGGQHQPRLQRSLTQQPVTIVAALPDPFPIPSSASLPAAVTPTPAAHSAATGLSATAAWWNPLPPAVAAAAAASRCVTTGIGLPKPRATSDTTQQVANHKSISAAAPVASAASDQPTWCGSSPTTYRSASSPSRSQGEPVSADWMGLGASGTMRSYSGGITTTTATPPRGQPSPRCGAGRPDPSCGAVTSDVESSCGYQQHRPQGHAVRYDSADAGAWATAQQQSGAVQHAPRSRSPQTPSSYPPSSLPPSSLPQQEWWGREAGSLEQSCTVEQPTSWWAHQHQHQHQQRLQQTAKCDAAEPARTGIPISLSAPEAVQMPLLATPPAAVALSQPLPAQAQVPQQPGFASAGAPEKTLADFYGSFDVDIDELVLDPATGSGGGFLHSVVSVKAYAAGAANMASDGGSGHGGLNGNTDDEEKLYAWLLESMRSTDSLPTVFSVPMPEPSA